MSDQNTRGIATSAQLQLIYPQVDVPFVAHEFKDPHDTSPVISGLKHGKHRQPRSARRRRWTERARPRTISERVCGDVGKSPDNEVLPLGFVLSPSGNPQTVPQSSRCWCRSLPTHCPGEPQPTRAAQLQVEPRSRRSPPFPPFAQAGAWCSISRWDPVLGRAIARPCHATTSMRMTTYSREIGPTAACSKIELSFTSSSLGKWNSRNAGTIPARPAR